MSKRRLVGAGGALLLLTGTVGVAGWSEINQGPGKFIKGNAKWSPHDGKNAATRQELAIRVLQNDTTWNRAKGLVMEFGGNAMEKVMLLFGPKGCGRELLVRQVALNWQDEVCYLDFSKPDFGLMEYGVVQAAKDQAEKMYNFPGAFVYQLYWRMNWSKHDIVEYIAKSNDRENVWIFDNVSATNDEESMAVLEMGINNAELNLFINASVDDANEFTQFVTDRTNVERINGLRLGDPMEKEEKASRLGGICAGVMIEDGDNEARQELEVKLHKKVGYRLNDLLELGEEISSCIQHNSDLSSKEVIQQSVDHLIERYSGMLKKRLTLDMDKEVAVWVYDTLGILCGTVPSVSTDIATDPRDNGLRVTALPRLELIESPLKNGPRTTVSGLTDGILEMKNTGQVNVICARPLIFNAFVDLARGDDEFVKSMETNQKKVYMAQDMFYLKEHMETYFAKKIYYDRCVELLEQLERETNGEEASAEVIHARLNVESEKRHLDSLRKVLIRRFDDIFAVKK